MKKNKQLIDELVNTFINFKRVKFQNSTNFRGLTHSEKMFLFMIKDISKNSIVSLSLVRERMKLAPSTITPIITLLEEKKLIQRNIDKMDRRNITLKISPKGEEYINKIQKEIEDQMSNYIQYIGENDTKELIRLIKKTTDFFSRKEDNNI